MQITVTDDDGAKWAISGESLEHPADRACRLRMTEDAAKHARRVTVGMKLVALLPVVFIAGWCTHIILHADAAAATTAAGAESQKWATGILSAIVAAACVKLWD